MVQEVQTSVNQPIQTTLETIQSVGTSSVKIREWRQTTNRTISYCTVDVGTSQVSLDGWETKSNIVWLFSNLSNTGKEEYAIWVDCLRIPTAWSYEITIAPYTWYSQFQVTTKLLLDWKEIYSRLVADGNDVEDKIKIDAGKYSSLTVRFTAYRASSSSISGFLGCDIWITQI